MRLYLKALGTALDNTDSSLAQLAQDVQTLDGELDATNVEVGAIAQNVQALDGELDDTNVEVGTIAQSVQGLQRQLYEIPLEYVRTYDTVADMQSDDNLLSGMVCHTNGFHANGDGGAAYYTVGASGTANGMDVLALQGGLFATLVVTEPYVTPEMFGAYGDGTHDDTAILRHCIKSDTNLELSGTYLISGRLAINSVSNFRMHGGTITRAANQTFNTIEGQLCDNITFDCVTFDGNGNDRDMTYTWKDNVQACIILSSNCKSIHVIDCTVLAFNYGVFILGADAMNVPTSYENSSLCGTIRGCMFHNCHSPIDTYGKGLAVDHNVLYDITGNAIQIEPNYTWSDSDNPLDDSNYYTSAVACIVSNNLLINVLGNAITVSNANSYGVSIVNNTVIDYKKGIDGIGKALTIDGNHLLYQKPQTVDSITRPWSWMPAIRVDSRAVVTNNYIWKADVGIFIAGGSTVNGNTIEQPRFSAIAVYMKSTTTDEIVIVTNNKIIGHVHNTDLWWGSRAIASGNSKNLFFDNNVVETDSQPLYVTTGSTASVSRLISNVAETDTITAPSGFSVYSN